MTKSFKLYPISQPLIFRVSGRDATRYLHGRVTQNIKAMKEGEALETLILTPQGKVQGRLWCKREENSYLFLSTSANETVESLLRFKVADDVVVEIVENLAALQILESSEIVEGSLDSLTNEISSVEIFKSSWGEASCYILLLPEKELPKLAANTALELASSEDREWLRISQLIPEMQRDLSEDISAPEIPLTNLVSFNKGCYAGQELVEMATARGRPNRKLIGLAINLELYPAAKTLKQGAAIQVINEAGAVVEKPVGYLSSLIAAPDGHMMRALGFIKSSTPDDSQLAVENIPAELFSR